MSGDTLHHVIRWNVGFLTGIAIRGVLFAPYGQTFSVGDGPEEGLHVYGERAFVVPKDHEAEEWTALQGFVEHLADWIAQAEKTFGSKKWGAVKTQICFWELRQYEELCNAFGRHLLKILDLSKKHQRALAWIFPAEELMERDTQLAPGLVFIRDIVNSAVRLPVRFATTLLGVVEHYHHPHMHPRHIDKYYLEPLGNAIPRERIFEIWKSSTGTVRLFGKTVSILDAMQQYADVLKAHTWALATAAHPEDDGRFLYYVPREVLARI